MTTTQDIAKHYLISAMEISNDVHNLTDYALELDGVTIPDIARLLVEIDVRMYKGDLSLDDYER